MAHSDETSYLKVKLSLNQKKKLKNEWIVYFYSSVNSQKVAIWQATGPLTSAPCRSHFVSPSPTLLGCDVLVLILQCLLVIAC